MTRIEKISKKIQPLNPGYLVSDKTDSGNSYGVHRIYADWESTWFSNGKEVKCAQFKVNGNIILNEEKGRLRKFTKAESRAYNRHQKELRIHLGLEQPKIKNVKLVKCIVEPYFNGELRVRELPETDKMIGEYRKTTHAWTTKDIENKIPLVEKYNKMLVELRNLNFTIFK